MSLAEAASDGGQVDTVAVFQRILEAEGAPAVDEKEPEETVEQQPETTPEDETQDELKEQKEEVATEKDELENIVFEVPGEDGQVEKVTAKELINSRLRQSDYTKKMQEISKEREGITQYETAARQAQAKYVEGLDYFIQQQAKHVDTLTPQQWAELERDDPQEYLFQRVKLEDRQKAFGNLIKEREAHVAELQNFQKAQAAKIQQNSDKILSERIPEWSDSQKRTQLQTQVSEYLQSVGYSAEEIGGIVDYRPILVALDAMKGRQLKADPKALAAKKVEKAPRIVKAGASRDEAAIKAEQRKVALKRVAQSGSAVDFFKQYL